MLPDNCPRLFKHGNVMKYQIQKNRQSREMRPFIKETKET